MQVLKAKLELAGNVEYFEQLNLTEAIKLGNIKLSRNGPLLNVEIKDERAHKLILRFRKKLRELLEKNKIGVRRLKVERLEVYIDGEEIVELPFAKMERTDRGVKIVLEDLSDDFLKKGNVDRLIKLYKEKVERKKWGGKKEHWELIWESNKREPIWKGDPTKEMVKRGWVRKYPHQGTWVYLPPFVDLMNTMRRVIFEEILEPLRFEEVVLPKLIPFEIWERTGHAKGILQEAYFLMVPKKRDPVFFEDVTDLVKVTREIPTDKLQEKLELKAGYCYAQCPPFYQLFRGGIVPDSLLPVKWFDQSGPSFRWEAGGIHGLERINAFHRVELVWLGKPEQVINIRDELLERYKYVFDEIFELEWRMAWVTPWYVAHSGETKVEDLNKRIIGTIDFEAWLPFRGDREKSEWLEFQNISIHGEKFTRPFNIRHQKGETLWTGCSGIGLERWIVTLLAQKGMDPDEWPEKFLKYVKRRPKDFKLVNW